LLKPSVPRPEIFTAEKRIVIKQLGRLQDENQWAVSDDIGAIVG
jgi:hypothetical protein